MSYIYPDLPKNAKVRLCMQGQLDEYFNDLLSKYQCGFRQGFGTQNCLLAMIEKLRKIRYMYRNSSNMHSDFKRLLETLLLTIKMCTGFTTATDVTWVNTKVWSVTSEPTQSSNRRVSSFKDSSALLNN